MFELNLRRQSLWLVAAATLTGLAATPTLAAEAPGTAAARLAQNPVAPANTIILAQRSGGRDGGSFRSGGGPRSGAGPRSGGGPRSGAGPRSRPGPRAGNGPRSGGPRLRRDARPRLSPAPRIGGRPAVRPRARLEGRRWGHRGRRYRQGARWYFWAPWLGSYAYFSSYEACYRRCRAEGFSRPYCRELCDW